MSTRRFLPAIVTAALVASGCNSQLGPTTPACDPELVTNSIILTAQAVRGAAYVPCLNDLKPGWAFENIEARSGRMRFWLSSDRVGQRFLEVVFEGSCDLTGSEEVASDEEQIPLYVEDVEADFFVTVTVIPEGGDEDLRAYANEVIDEIGSSRVENRLVKAGLDATDVPTAQRIQDALDRGEAALVVGAREYEERTVELHFRRPGAQVTVERGLDPGDAVEEFAEPLGDPVYRAVWRYPFENGCVTYRFHARGVGAERISYDVMDALGFLDLGPIRAFGDQVGYVVP